MVGSIRRKLVSIFKDKEVQMQCEITLADAGRGVAFVRGIDWDWHRQPEGVVVLDVQIVYPCPGVCVKIGNGNGTGYWYSMADIRLEQVET